MKSEDIRPEAVVDEPVREVPNVPDDIYSDAPVSENIPVLTLGDTGVDAPMLDADADEKMAEDAKVDDSADESVTDVGIGEAVANESVADVSVGEAVANESVADVGVGETVADESVTDVGVGEAVADEVAAVGEDADDTAEEMTGDTDALPKGDEGDVSEEDGGDSTEAEANGTDAKADTSLSDDVTVAVEPPKKEKEPAAVENPRTGKKKESTAKDKVGERRVDGLFDFIELFVFTLAIVLFVTSFFVRQSVVEGDSMLGTLHDKETLLISDFFYEPKRGDIVVVDDRSAYHVPIIKRVIAVGGDTVRITKVGVIVNGELLNEPYVYTDGGKYEYHVEYRDIAHAIKQYETLKYKDGEYYEFVVPEGKIFVMGDHRNASTDSRDLGPLDVDAVLGRVIYRILPFSVFGPVE